MIRSEWSALSYSESYGSSVALTATEKKAAFTDHHMRVRLTPKSKGQAPLANLMAMNGALGKAITWGVPIILPILVSSMGSEIDLRG